MAQQAGAVLFAQVVFFQGIGASMHQVRRVANVLFPVDALKQPKDDLSEIIYPGHEHETSWLWRPFHWVMMLFTRYLRFPYVSYSLHASKVNIGQEADVNALALRDRGIPAEQLVSAGISRGALTTFVRHAKSPDRKARLVLLEGCPDSIPNVLEYRYGQLAADGAEWFLERFTAYKKDNARRMSPLSLAPQFPQDVPVAFVTSERDTSVPAAGTLRLVEALKMAGHKKVHLLVLKDGNHNDYLTSKRDRRAYLDFVKQLYDTYGVKFANTSWSIDNDEIVGSK